MEIPVDWFAAAPAAFVLLLAPLLSAAFGFLRRRGREPQIVHKIALGLAMGCLAFVPLWGATPTREGQGSRLRGPIPGLGCLAMLAAAELLVPALAPAEIARLAPPGRSGRWLSYWFVALAAGTCSAAGCACDEPLLPFHGSSCSGEKNMTIPSQAQKAI